MRLYEGAEAYFRARSAPGSTASPPIRERVAVILSRVRVGGDRALLELTEELDRVSLAVGDLRVPPSEIERSAARAPEGFHSLLARAAANIRRFHEHQAPRDFALEDAEGAVAGQRHRPIESVGVYVPGGEASYPSSVLMNVIPAQIAGVERIAAATPPGALERSPELAAAFHLLQVREVYRVGGAQAVAALAFGTESIEPVAKIVGPGNAYVAEAKRLLFGVVGIDAVAGPSEIVVLADGAADPRYVAADLLSQAEHGSGDERAILVTTSRVLALRVIEELERQTESLPRRQAIRPVLDQHGAVILVASVEEAIAAVDRIAPEHLEVLAADADAVAARVRNAGAIFLGEWSPVPVGDFYAGPNHVLPTGATARFASPLGVSDFIKRTSFVRYTREALARDREDIEAFARAEGFEAHARAISIRFDS